MARYRFARQHGRLAVKTAISALALLAASAGNAAAAEQPTEGAWLLDHVTVVDVEAGTLLPDRAILITDGRIAAIGPAGAATSNKGGRNAAKAANKTADKAIPRIDGGGAYVVPGFNDMHAHNLNSASPGTSLPLMLANGVTGFRQMAGVPGLLAARAAGKTGTVQLPENSPALLALPGAVLAGAAVASPDAARAAVDAQQREGADFIKTVDLPPSAFAAAAKEAHKLGLPLAGHLSPLVDPRTAIGLHMTAIEHMGPGISLLLACSSREGELRAALAAAAANNNTSHFDANPAAIARMLVNPILSTPPQGFAMIAQVLDSYDPAKCQTFARELAASNSWVVPTLTRLEAMELGDTPALRDNPDLHYVPADVRALWQSVGTEFRDRLSDEQKQILARLFAAQTQLTGLFAKADVKMLTGTDFGGGWIVPGASLHHEFDLLAKAGLSPLQILRMTTIDAARFLGREGEMGNVRPGRAADLVLLRADPLADVANLHGIAAVVRAGRYLDGDTLTAIKTDIEQRLAASH